MKTAHYILFVAQIKANLLLSHDGCVVVQRVAQHVATHALARLIVKILKEWWEVLELQHCQDVVVGVHWNLQQSGELLGHSAAGCYAAGGRGKKRLKIKPGQEHGCYCLCCFLCIVSLSLVVHIRLAIS